MPDLKSITISIGPSIELQQQQDSLLNMMDSILQKEESRTVNIQGDITTRFFDTIRSPESVVEIDWTRAPPSAKPVRPDFGPLVPSICTPDFGNDHCAETPAIPLKRRVKLDNKQPVLTIDVPRSLELQQD